MDELLRRLENPFIEDNEWTLVVRKLVERLSLVEGALDEVYPQWRFGGCLPSCRCAACGEYE